MGIASLDRKDDLQIAGSVSKRTDYAVMGAQQPWGSWKTTANFRSSELPLLMQWTAPTLRHLGAKMVVYMNHREIGAVL